MLSLHWKIISPNLYRHRLKKVPELAKEMKALPQYIKPSHFYDLKSIILSSKNLKLEITPGEFLPLDKDFNHSASKLQISLLNIVNLLGKIQQAFLSYEKATEGFFNKLWKKVSEKNPLEDIELQIALYQKIFDFDQNLRSFELNYLHNLKRLLSARKSRNKKREAQKKAEESHIIVRQNNDNDKINLNQEKTLKHSNSVASTNKIDSQILTDAILTTMIRKKTESGSIELDADLINFILRSEEGSSKELNSTLRSKLKQELKHNVSMQKLISLNNTEGDSRVKSFCSQPDNFGYIDTLKDCKYNRKVQLKEENYEESEESEEEKEQNEVSNLENSVRHIRNVRSRGYSYSSTARSQNQLGAKPSPSNVGPQFSGDPSNKAILDIIRKEQNNCKLARKDYSKRTRVSVLDSSISSLMKNSVVGDYQLVENQNKDPNSKSISSGGSKSKGHYYAKTNPGFHFNKFKDIKPGYKGKAMTRSILTSEYNSPNLGNSSNTPQSLSREFPKDLNITPIVGNTSPSYTTNRILDSHSGFKEFTSDQTSHKKPPRNDLETIHKDLSEDLQKIWRERENSPSSIQSPYSPKE